MIRYFISTLIICVCSFSMSAQWSFYNGDNTWSNIPAQISKMFIFNNEIWMSTNDGIIKYSLINHTWVQKRFDYSNEINDVKIGSSTIWAASNGGGIYYTTNFTGNWMQITKSSGMLSSNFVRSIYIDNYNNKWFSTYGGGICVYRSNGQWEQFTTSNGLSSNFIISSLRDQNFNIWFATKSSGIMKYDGSNWHIINADSGLISNKINSIYRDNYNRIWVCGEGGVSIIENGLITRNITSSNGMYGQKFYSAVKMLNDNYWVGSNIGITVLSNNYEVIDTIKTQNDVLCILENTNRVFIGHAGNGLSYYYDNQLYNYCGQNGLGYSAVLDIASTRTGKVWLINNRSIIEFDNIIWKQHPAPTSYSSESKIAIDTNNQIWIVWDKKLYRYTDSSYQQIPTEMISAEGIQELLVDSFNRVWCTSIEGEVYYYNEGAWHYEYNCATELNCNVFKICVLGFNDVAFATNKGVVRIKNGIKIVYDRHDGLISNYPTDVTVDKEGMLWASFNQENGGVCRFDGNTWIKYTNLHSPYLNFVFCDSKGGIWTGGSIYDLCLISRYYQGNWSTYRISNDNIYWNINKMIEDKYGNLWIAGYNLYGVFKGNVNAIGIEEQNQSSNVFLMYPNPANNKVYVKNEYANIEDVILTIYNLHGEIVYEKKIEKVLSLNEIIDVSTITSGVYVVNILTKTQSSSTKLIISNDKI